MPEQRIRGNPRAEAYSQRQAHEAERDENTGNAVSRAGAFAKGFLERGLDWALHGPMAGSRHGPQRAFEEIRRLESLGLVTRQEKEHLEQMLKTRGEDATPAQFQEVQKFIEERYKVVQRTERVRRGLFKDLLFLAEHGLFEEEEIGKIWQAVHDPQTNWQQLQQIAIIVNERMLVAKEQYKLKQPQTRPVPQR
ncbi:MAG: hypothetical protein HY394_00405 [Candidatus Diapherotrites archaeon]|nr:hypothetical protein [Candidatus Diapherotrites archaeon]